MAVSGSDIAGDVGVAAAGGFNPISIGLGLAGLAMQVFGGLGAADVSKQTAKLSAGVAEDEQQVNVQKRQQMQLEANRQQLQNFRNVQQARARSLESATNQGAQFGSGLQGGLASATSEGNVNALGISQNLEIGQNIFGIEGDISSKRVQMAQLGGKAATDQGIASLGGAVLKSGPTIGSFTKNLFGVG